MQTVVCRLQSGVRDERTDGSVVSARLAEVEVARWREHTVLQLRCPHEDQRARRSQHRLLRSALLFICQLTAKTINEGCCQLSGEGASSVLAAILPRSDSRQCSSAERVEPLTACLNRWCVGSCARREVSFGAGAVHAARTQIRQRARQSAPARRAPEIHTIFIMRGSKKVEAAGSHPGSVSRRALQASV